jgi:hypothetical protein
LSTTEEYKAIATKIVSYLLLDKSENLILTRDEVSVLVGYLKECESIIAMASKQIQASTAEMESTLDVLKKIDKAVTKLPKVGTEQKLLN